MANKLNVCNEHIMTTHAHECGIGTVNYNGKEVSSLTTLS